MPSPDFTPQIALRRLIPKPPTGDAAVVRIARAIATGQPLTPQQVIVGVRYFRANKDGTLLGGEKGDRWFRAAYRQLQQKALAK